MANIKTVCSPALEMRYFVDGISMNFARLIIGEIQAEFARTNFKNGSGAVLTYEGQNLPGK